jgi:hypothetical protein
MYGEHFFWDAWGALHDTVKSGEPAFERVHGERFFDYLGHHTNEAAVFNDGMTSASKFDLLAILDAYDFSPFKRIVDVAGGHGALLRGILERCPHATGVLCDLPSVIAGATAITESRVASRAELVEADMFQSVPSGGDAYILKRILHDWSDADATRILRSCRRAIASTGKLLVIDCVLNPPNEPDPGKLMDLNMLVLLRGRERTEVEFRELLAAAGFTLTRIVPAGRVAVVEGVPLAA